MSGKPARKRLRSERTAKEKAKKQAIAESRRNYFDGILPVELIAHILSYVPSPKDILALARCNQHLCAVLLNKSQGYIWKRAREECSIGPMIAPPLGWSEAAHAAFVFDGGNCEVRGLCERCSFGDAGAQERSAETDVRVLAIGLRESYGEEVYFLCTEGSALRGCKYDFLLTKLRTAYLMLYVMSRTSAYMRKDVYRVSASGDAVLRLRSQWLRSIRTRLLTDPQPVEIRAHLQKWIPRLEESTILGQINPARTIRPVQSAHDRPNS